MEQSLLGTDLYWMTHSNLKQSKNHVDHRRLCDVDTLALSKRRRFAAPYYEHSSLTLLPNKLLETDQQRKHSSLTCRERILRSSFLSWVFYFRENGSEKKFRAPSYSKNCLTFQSFGSGVGWQISRDPVFYPNHSRAVL
jgi:hypothetical protein